jgi:lysozyme
MSDPFDIKAMSNRLTAEEGVRRLPYKDTLGVLSIGVGRNLMSVGLRPDEIQLMLNNDIEQCITDLDLKLPWWRNMTDNRKMALCDMCFQLGINGLLLFKNMLTQMQVNRYDLACEAALDSTWAKQTPARANSVVSLILAG